MTGRGVPRRRHGAPRRGRRAGFTLIEVLVALMIVALGMGAVLSALSSSANSTIRLREKTFATWVGLNQLTEARLNQNFPAKGKIEKDAEFAKVRWHWQQEVEDTQFPDLRRITVRVSYADAAPERGPVKGGGMGDKRDWLATVSGFRSLALKSPEGTLQGWP